MAAQAHAAFPSVAQTSRRLPQNEEELLALVGQCSSKEAIRDTLIPALFDLAEGRSQSDNRAARRARRTGQGSAILRLSDTDISAFDAEQVSANTALVLFALSARLEHARKTSAKNKQGINSMLDMALQIFTLGDIFQLRLCGPRVSMLASETLLAIKQREKVEQLALGLSTLASRAGLSHAFWGVYSVLLEACLFIRQYDFSQPLLDITFIDFVSYGPRYLEVITFYHHLGLVHAALGNFAKATAAFVTAVSAPTLMVSAIQLLCAKRAILCGLLDDGKLARFPPYCTGLVTRAVDRHAKEYTKLAKAFTDSNWSVVMESAKSSDFAADQNQGLLDQVLESILRRRIQAVRRHCSRMLVSDLAQRIQAAEVIPVPDLVEVLHSMIESGELRAILSASTEQDSPIVTFLDEDEDYTSPTKLREIAAMKGKADWLRKEMQRANRAMGISRDYLIKQAYSLEQSGGSGARREGDPSDLDLIVPGDEDIGMSQPTGSKGLRRARAVRGAGSNLFDTGF